ncbi:GNAT family N-acetyltransferase [Crossiella sp. SN42]|uniref:GNAT family N-acetyltransferase n=1 Tax=Crossiella sp. SN42 TaxID=2944808 RepID=UPI00207C71D2|nr:GNAT family N-acetyltransferase [Crossiella sp. SN42]MCO1578657.1 GNAT family N-acetyltransferase [Crossiella sp. SN42]
MTAPPEQITTDRLVLRRLHLSDVDEVQTVAADALPHLRPWMPWAGTEYTRETATNWLTFVQEGWRTGTAYSYGITRAGNLIGATGLERRIGPGGLEIGYWLHPAHTGNGYATETAAALTRAAFTLPDITFVQIWHDLANTRSAAVPKRLGFTEVARHEPPREPLSPGKIGVDVVWQLNRPPS